MLYIGADHRGFLYKEKTKEWLTLLKYEYKDMGASALDPKDDYTLFAEKVALMVSQNLKAKGILICGSGVGVANKFDGIRASLGKNPQQVKAGRQDDNMNILVIASDFTQYDEAKAMISVFLTTKFKGKERHKRRLADITRIEENN